MARPQQIRALAFVFLFSFCVGTEGFPSSPTDAETTSTEAVSSSQSTDVEASSSDVTPTTKVVVDAPPENAEVNPSVPIVFREKVALRLFYQRDLEKSEQQKKAREASRNLDKAMTAPDNFEPEARLVDVLLTKRNTLDIRVRGYRVAELSDRDRKAAGAKSMQDYQEQVLVELNSFVSDEFDRVKIQRIALQFFLSVFFALMGFVVFRKVGSFFNQADVLIEERRESFKPLVIFNENLVSGPTLGALLSLLLVLGRLLAYMVVVLSTLAAISGQFRSSRDLMGKFFSQMATQILKALQSLLEGIPGLLLATLLALSLYLGFKFLNLFLKSINTGRLRWSLIEGQRVPVIRLWGSIFISAVFLPLIIASLFGRFESPIETMLLTFAGVVALANLPVLASFAVGSFILWSGHLRLGQWVRVGNLHGEITDLSLFRITLVPEQGGRIQVPMVQLALYSLQEGGQSLEKTYWLTVQRKQSAEETLQLLRKIVMEAKLKVEFQMSGATSEAWQFTLRWQPGSGAPDQLQLTLAKAIDQGEISLVGLGLQEIKP